MSRKRKSRNKRKARKPSRSKKKVEKTVPPKKSSTRKLVSITLGLLAMIGTLLGIWTVLRPNVSVNPGVALDPNKPAFTTFTIHNQGYLPVYDVKLSCSVKYLEFPGNTHVIGLGDYSNRFSNPKHVADKISPDEQYSELLPLSSLEHNDFQNADIAIVLTFKWLWRRTSLHRFIAVQGKDGQWHWLPRPIKK